MNVVKVKVAQSYLTLCDPMDYTVYGILQARILEWVAVPFSRISSQSGSPSLQADSFLLPTREAQSPKERILSTSFIRLAWPWYQYLKKDLTERRCADYPVSWLQMQNSFLTASHVTVQITIITHLDYWNDLISTLIQSPILKAASRIILLNMSNDLSFLFHSIPGLLSHIDLYVVPKTLTTFSSQGLCTSSPLVWSILTLNKFTCLIPTSLSDLCPKATPSLWISVIVLFSH